MGDIVLLDEMTSGHNFREEGQQTEISDANALIPANSNMRVIVRRYKGPQAQKVHSILLAFLLSHCPSLFLFFSDLET